MLSFTEFGKEKPSLSYNRKLNKVVLNNGAAFWVVIMAMDHPEILEGGIDFDFDEHFLEYYHSLTGSREVLPRYVNFFIKTLVDEANEDAKWLEEDSQKLWLGNQGNIPTETDLSKWIAVNSKGGHSQGATIHHHQFGQN
ncbi:hypothetical protein CMO96_00290 [Candidatus Woesebacteria bacterium]|nr:hypothetical protein [Candidatus Woesebacteria bacterium]